MVNIVVMYLHYVPYLSTLVLFSLGVYIRSHEPSVASLLTEEADA